MASEGLFSRVGDWRGRTPLTGLTLLSGSCNPAVRLCSGKHCTEHATCTSPRPAGGCGTAEHAGSLDRPSAAGLTASRLLGRCTQSTPRREACDAHRRPLVVQLHMKCHNWTYDNPDP